MKLGIGSYTYTWAVGVPGHEPPQPMTALALLRRARDLGAGVVQFCDNLPLTALSPAELDAFQAFAVEHGIEIELGTRGLVDQANLRAYLDLAQRFHASFVRIVVDSTGHEPAAPEVVSLLRPVLDHYAKAGVKLALENHDRFPAAVLAGVVEQLGPERIGICLDTVNSLGALEGPEQVVAALAPYALNLHVKDFTIQRVSSQMGFVVNGCPVGQGRLNVPWLLDQLRAARRNVNAIVELWTPFGPTIEATLARETAWAAESVLHLRRFIPD
jgi:3-oxoisoapionate decarboxylase